jgi:hypothetical protein
VRGARRGGAASLSREVWLTYAHNLAKTFDRWPIERKFPALFDEKFPPEEQLPRKLTIDIFERVVKSDHSSEKRYVIQRCNGIFIGDRLTDNIMAPDDYSFRRARVGVVWA